MRRKIAGGILIVLGLAIVGFVWYRNSLRHYQTIVFSPRLMLTSLWESYKKEYWDPRTGRTLDKQRGNITTSEGQSYTMLRAVWQDDKPTFDKTWGWVQSNLKRPDDNLFAWLYGKRPDGSDGILTDQGGQNAATDADTDIAMALLFASGRWGDASYLKQAQSIIADIWNSEIVQLNGSPYAAANNNEKNSPSGMLINPSYLSPYAYRMFAKVDPRHNWLAVVDSSYDILSKASISPLDKTISAGLVPDWLTIDRKSLQLAAPATDGLTTNYSYDALRTPFRIYLDWLWFKEPRAQDTLKRFYFLDQEWESKKILASVYGHDGELISNTETPAFYAGALGYFLAIKPKTAEEVYKLKLENLYSPDFQDWKKRLGYYDDNWTWFALALYNKTLNNLFPI